MMTHASSAEDELGEPNPSEAESASRALDGARRMSPALRTGLCLGALLNIVMIAALVAANRFPGLENYALERDAVSSGLFFLLCLYPVVRFLNRPLRMFVAGIVGWILFVAGYDMAGLYFHSLFDVLRTPFEVLVEGVLIYGIAAAVVWVARMALHARHNPVAPRRRSVHHVAGHNQ
jgi:hypothetical protein